VPLRDVQCRGIPCVACSIPDGALEDEIKLMSTRKITAAVIAAMKSDDVIFDTATRGFCVRARARDRSFLVRVRIDGKQKALTIGRYEPGVLGVEDARKIAQSWIVDARAGKDPTAVREARKAAPTLAELAERYIVERSVPHKKPNSVRQDKQMLRQHIIPQLGQRRAIDISKSDVAKLHFGMRETPAAANRCCDVLSSVLGWAEEVGIRPDGTNPCRGVKRNREKRRENALTSADLGKLGEALAKSKEDWRSVAAIRLLLFSGARMNEILSLKWEYIDTDRGVANLPDSKSGATKRYLPAAALAVLASLPRMAGSPFVLPGDRAGKPFQGLEKPWQRIRATIGLEKVRLHDLRHTYASVAVSDGVSLFVVGELLGHKQAATTKRYAHLASDPARAFADKNGERLLSMLDGKVAVPAAG
jgi:integrase